jgi:hypothetical protein
MCLLVTNFLLRKLILEGIIFAREQGTFFRRTFSKGTFAGELFCSVLSYNGTFPGNFLMEIYPGNFFAG